jgi:putative ABC transport system substrate-binding protein
MKRKLTALISAAAMMLSLVACGSADPAPAPEAPAAPEAAEKYTVGIVQLVPHVALDAATQGFKDALNEALPGQVEFTGGVAAGDAATCTPIVTDLVASNVDLIMANATPALQAAAAATADIPILGTSVTEYGVALDIDNFTGLVGSNISGTSDLAPLDAQAAMIKEWFPDTKTVGLIYCSAEANSQYQVDEIQKLLEADGITCTQYPFSDSNDMAAIVQTAADNSDVIYAPTDNTVASNAGIIDNICRPAGVPVIAGEEGLCAGCGVATLSISYYDLGVATGKMAAKILTGEAKIEEMPIGYAETVTPKFNETICTELGITVPAGYNPIG